MESGRLLDSAGVAAPRLDAEVLLAEAIQVRREELFSRPDRVLDSGESARFHEYVERRRQREPVAYILGRKEFWSMDFRVSPDVLIPRPESECLLRRLSALVDAYGPNRSLRILDLCTGSGNLAVAAAKQFPQAKVVAMDISAQALEIARDNALQHGVAGQIDFLQEDVLRPEWQPVSPESPEFFHYIISNPPYIRRDAVAGLIAEVSGYEPAQALDGGHDGLMFYEKIIPLAIKSLHRSGHVMVEIGDEQEDDVVRLFESMEGAFKTEVIQDYDGMKRVISAMRMESRG